MENLLRIIWVRGKTKIQVQCVCQRKTTCCCSSPHLPAITIRQGKLEYRYTTKFLEEMLLP